jgi:hypothetical protein
VEFNKPGFQGCRSGILELEGINLYAYLSVDLWMSVQESRDLVIPNYSKTTRNLVDQNGYFSNLGMGGRVFT